MKIRRYFAYYTILALIGLVLVGALNYYCDPAHIFSGGQSGKAIADILLSGGNINNLSDYDERAVQEDYIANMPSGKDVVVLGSSRSMQIRSELFPGKSFFNSCVSGASLEDYLAIYELYFERNYLPSTVVLGLDPWILNRNNDQTRWSSLQEHYFAMAERLRIPSSLLSKPLNTFDTEKQKFIELISLSYFRQSVIQIYKGKANLYEPSQDGTLNDGGILADGSHVYDMQFRTRPADEVYASAISYAREEPVYSLGGFTSLDEAYRVQLIAFVRYLQENNAHV